MDDDILQKNICCEFLALLMQTQHVCSWLGMQGFMGLEFLQRQRPINKYEILNIDELIYLLFLMTQADSWKKFNNLNNQSKFDVAIKFQIRSLNQMTKLKEYKLEIIV